MPVYKRGNSWMVSVGSGSGRYRASFQTRAEAEAAELAEKLRRKTSGNASRSSVQAPQGVFKAPVEKTLKEAFERAYRLHWKGTKSERTTVINALAVVKVLGEETLVSSITTEDVTEMVLEFEDQGNSGSTVNRKLSTLSTMLRTAQEQWPGCLPSMPTLSRRREGKHRIRWMDEAEEKTALEACEHLGLYDLKDYIEVAIDTGFRRSELLGFEIEDYQNGLLILHEGKTKNDRARSVPATSRVDAIINRRRNFRRLFEGMTNNTLRWQWERLRDYLGMADDPQFVVHMLRHTCASRLVQRGVPLAIVQAWMGHTTISTTMRYAHLAPASLEMAKAALEVVSQEDTTSALETLEAL